MMSMRERGREGKSVYVYMCVGGGGGGEGGWGGGGGRAKVRRESDCSLVILTPGIVLHCSLKCKVLCASEEQVLC